MLLLELTRNTIKSLDVCFTQEQYNACRHFFGKIRQCDKYNYGIVIVASWTPERHKFFDRAARDAITNFLAAIHHNLHNILYYDLQMEVLNYL